MQMYAAPKTEHASNFLGAANIVDVQVSNATNGMVVALEDGQTFELAGRREAEGKQRLVIRQEDVRLHKKPASNTVEGTVQAAVFLGPRHRYVIATAGGTMRVLADKDVMYERGEQVSISFPSDRVNFLS